MDDGQAIGSGEVGGAQGGAEVRRVNAVTGPPGTLICAMLGVGAFAMASGA